MATITTLNQIIAWFRQYADQHPLLRDFGYGATDMIGSTKAMSYPYLWVASTNNNPITISNHVVQPEFEFLVMVVDALSDQTQTDPDNGYIATNEQDVLSDTYQIVQDFVAWLNTSWRPTGITIDANLNAQPVTDTTPDRVSGWAITITMKVPYRTCVSGIDIVAPEIYTSLTTQNAVTASYAITAGTASYFSGSISNAVNATNAISASWAATASYFSGSISNATNAISASYALTASYALNGGGGNIDTSSFITAAQTASMTVLSASYAATASYFKMPTSGLFADVEYGTVTSQSGNWRTTTSASALLMQYWDALNSKWVTDTIFTGTPYSGSGGAVASSSYAATSSYSDYSVTSSYVSGAILNYPDPDGTTAPILRIVSITSASYAALSVKDANTVYMIV
jgi:hypothetical protein